MMKRLAFITLLAVTGMAATVVPAQAHDHGHARLSIGLGFGGGYYPYYSPYYYGYPYYGPPVVYAEPPPVIYTQPAPVYVTPPETALPSTQASPTYTDQQGRTCRQFQSTIDNAPVSGTACLQPDGTWRTVE
ncbi:MAG: hypothetical protein P4M15_07005 [Alphaproteobacteria bacterium]|nr:hypothetical protein [Alphaproteobacteria bacterium]